MLLSKVESEAALLSGRYERASTAFTIVTPLASARVTSRAGGQTSAIGSYPTDSIPNSRFHQQHQPRRNIAHVSAMTQPLRHNWMQDDDELGSES